ncbi:MAG TPA: hypothetical protein VF174_08950 [Micromonosporaceae bacterium]
MREPKPLDFDEPTVVSMLAALLTCPPDKRTDSVAVVVKALVEVVEP